MTGNEISPEAAERFALRTRSLGARQFIARKASRGQFDYDALVSFLGEGSGQGQHAIRELEPNWAIRLGRVVAFHPFSPSDVHIGTNLQRHIYNRSGLAHFDPQLLWGFTQLLVVTGDWALASVLLPELHGLARGETLAIEADLINPYLRQDANLLQPWAETFSDLFRQHGLPGISVGKSGRTPFDQITVVDQGEQFSSSLVSVIITSYCPDLSLLTSVRSIASQTWKNLEIIVIDDGSPASYDEIYQQVTALDERVRLVRQHPNGGTYLARNRGIREARGVLITGQDSDDWSHPRRIELQAEPLLRDLSVTITRSRSARVDERLVLSSPGFSPYRPNASSVMFRAADVAQYGFFDSVRRGADSEFFERYAQGNRSVDLPQVLALVRLRGPSLSRGDFLPGWQHPARRAYRMMFDSWHRSPEFLESAPKMPWDTRVPRPFPAPITYLQGITDVGSDDQLFDVVVLADWFMRDGSESILLDEVSASTSRGLRVGLIHVESGAHLRQVWPALAPRVQQQLRSGAVSLVQLDQAAHTKLLLVRAVDSLRYLPSTNIDLGADRVVVVDDHPPPAMSGGSTNSRSLIEEAVTDRFQAKTLWINSEWISVRASGDEVRSRDHVRLRWPIFVDTGRFAVSRSIHRGDRPVLGRSSSGSRQEWPSLENVHLVYPDDCTLDVRFRGSVKMLAEQMVIPQSWVVYRRRDLSARQFYAQLDFYAVFSEGSLSRESVTLILQAMAAGCIPVLSPEYQGIFGDAAIAASPSEVNRVVRSVWEDTEELLRRRNGAVDWVVQKYGREVYLSKVEEILGEFS